MKLSKLDKSQLVKVLKAAGYAGISAVLAALIAATVANPVLFGVLTPVINVLLVTLKQLFTPVDK